MPIRKFRPTSDGRRNASGYTFEELTKKEPEKSLLATKTRTNGRGWGKISTRHRGGGAKRRIRIAKGSGVTVSEVNNLLNRFSQMQQMMKKMGKFQKMMGRMGGMMPGMMR